jgi:hypothetical protein
MLVSFKEYIKPESKVAIFFLGPYDTPMIKLIRFIKKLNSSGFTVVTFEFTRDIFITGEPDKLIQVIYQTKSLIKTKIKELKKIGYTEFGFVGSSLGGFIAYNCLGSIPELNWGVIIAGGNITEAIWSFETERKQFELNGISKIDLKKSWYKIQYPDLGNLKNKKFVLVTSLGDKTASYKDAIECCNLINRAGSETKLIIHKRIGHKKTVLLNLLRVKNLVKLVRNYN